MSNSKSDMTLLNDWLLVGGSKRNLQQSGADSPAAEPRSTKRLKSLERVLSVGTVLQCVDKRCDRDCPFDAAVGQRPATVHEVTEGNCFEQPRFEHPPLEQPPFDAVVGQRPATVHEVTEGDSSVCITAFKCCCWPMVAHCS